MSILAPGTKVRFPRYPDLGIGTVQGGKLEGIKDDKQDKAREFWVMVHWTEYKFLSEPRIERIQDLEVVESTNRPRSRSRSRSRNRKESNRSKHHKGGQRNTRRKSF